MRKICAKCKEELTGEYDPCLRGYLPGIAHACCGHGKDAEAYCVGWDDCKPNEPIVNSDRTTCSGSFDGYWELHNNEWKFIPPEKGYFNLRAKEAIEYMNSLKKK